MIVVRAVLAVLMIALGATIFVRLLALGLRIETVTGMVLGLAMILLGAHRLTLIARLRRTP